MSAKAIREYSGKQLLGQFVARSASPDIRYSLGERAVSVNESTDLELLPDLHPWLLSQRLVVKPDQLIKRRGKGGLLGLDMAYDDVKAWLNERRGQPATVDGVTGTLRTFLIEPFVPHSAADEYYVCMYGTREGDRILFHHEGGVDIGDVDAKARVLDVAVDAAVPDAATLTTALLGDVPTERQAIVAEFVHNLFVVYRDLFFTYLEINPLVVVDRTVYALDLAAKLDQCADFEVGTKWGAHADFPPPFGRDSFPAERLIADMDAKTGASLKLTILNANGRIWTMVAGGGASVVYADTVAALGHADQLANYGEYSGAPNEAQTYEYAKTILELMLAADTTDKVLIIGGGIANFTNVAATFKGIVTALTEFQERLREQSVRIFVRRGGPNWQEGLSTMRKVGRSLQLDIHVFGPETHMTAIVGMALGARAVVDVVDDAGRNDVLFEQALGLETTSAAGGSDGRAGRSNSLTAGTRYAGAAAEIKDANADALFSARTRAFVFGMQPRAVQSMLDFDYCCERDTPSVAAIIYPFGGNHVQKFYWGKEEILMPVYERMADAVRRFPEVDTVVNFASFRSVFESVSEALQFDAIRTIAIIAEGVPERRTKQLIALAAARGVTLIGPATVGGVKPGCFRIGNTGGMLDNVLAAKLYRPGSVAYVSKSGGLSNELNNIISRAANGVYEGVAIGGDRYPGTTFLDHILRFQDDPAARLIVLLGEVGGDEEYRVADAIRSGRITKPVVAWCIGTCAAMFTTEVQFGHAGSCANSRRETADAKNAALAAAGAVVPDSFDHIPDAIFRTYCQLVDAGTIVLRPEPPVPRVPMDYSWAQELGLIRKPAAFLSRISDDRGQELMYSGMKISDVFRQDIGVGGVIALLWFRRLLPDYACKFIEMVLIVTADHGPAVSGAHNTIVTTRAGKDLISSLVSGLLTIGPRFGGAVDGAAKEFRRAYDENLPPREFVAEMRRKRMLIPGIGHRIKSRENPDMRVEILKDFVKKNFRAHPLLDYALEVEDITTAKKGNLILNVDGITGVAFVDLLRTCGGFSREEADEFLDAGFLNGLFVAGRTIGLIGHHLDQKLLRQGLYRHPWDDISYIPSDDMSNQ